MSINCLLLKSMANNNPNYYYYYYSDDKSLNRLSIVDSTQRKRRYAQSRALTLPSLSPHR